VNLNQALNLLASVDKEGQINSFSLKLVAIASISLVVLTIIASLTKHHDKLKLPLFLLMAYLVIAPTITLFATTVYLNVTSDSKGPVHWHTDIEVWACGQELELRDPEGALSNKIGTATYHEHNDKRIHLEGVVIDKEYDASLEKFFAVTGGAINDDGAVVPVEESFLASKQDGDKFTPDPAAIDKLIQKNDEGKFVANLTKSKSCNDSGSSELQAFLLRFNKGQDTYSQQKLEKPSAYIMRDEATVPPGDCLILEFDQPKDKTDKLCQQYGIRDTKRCKDFGVEDSNPKLCKLEQVESTEGEP
jgi:hypothetical protein